MWTNCLYEEWNVNGQVSLDKSEVVFCFTEMCSEESTMSSSTNTKLRLLICVSLFMCFNPVGNSPV